MQEELKSIRIINMDSEENNYNDILRGRYQHIFKDRSKTVKIFLSSTFTGDLI
jgi:hypothetical protein